MPGPGRSDPLLHAFLEHPCAARLLPPGGHALVALSGGLDSTVLLHLLRAARSDRPLQLTAAHFDHGMRADSARDAAWVRGLCRAWEVPLLEGRAATPLRGEAAARAARYGFLDACAREVGADCILTAHQLDDQVETVLFRIARGTGLRGLGGIPARRGRVLRPLLPFRRAELLAYALRARARWREDSTNRRLGYARNRIRLAVLPQLEREWPEAVVRIDALARLAREVESYWRALVPQLAAAALVGPAPGGFRLARGVLQEYHPASRARVMRYFLHRLAAEPHRAGTRLAVDFVAAGASGTGISLPGGVRLEREFGHILLRRPAEPGTGSVDRPIRIPTPGPGRGEGTIGGRGVRAEWGPDVAPGAAQASFDPAALRFPLVLRGWLPGDRIVLPYGSKKVKKLLLERRVGRAARAAVLVLAEQEGAGRVLWVAEHAQTAAVPARGARTWQIRVTHGESG